MTRLPASLERAIHEFSKLPGIGPKSAQRLALYLLKRDSIDLNNLSGAISSLKEGVTFCSTCHNMADTDPCSVCADQTRDHTLIAVVEEPLDALALDKTEHFKGVFHVLGGVLNPMEGIGAGQLNIDSLHDRIAKQGVTEVIIATNPTLEGETTAMHLARSLKDTGVKVTRIARGLPMGGDLEYADEITLSRALEGRREF
ncbi:MAG: recombination protein RecR [Candidatus Doudnabacteria bacterium]|nr:recombination protein RecR [Candidatus Doudnabacteria bacterium]